LNSNPLLLSIIVPMKSALLDMQKVCAWAEEIEQKNTELVVALDTPLENEKSFAESLIRNSKNPGIKLITGDFGGPGPARNAGFTSSNGEWVVFWDSDDLPMCDEVYAALQAKSADTDLIICAYQIDNSKTKSYFPVDWEYTLEKNENIKNILLTPGIWRYIFLRKAIENVQFPSTKMGEDQVFLLQIDLPSRNIHLHQKVIYEYVTGNSESLTGNKTNLSELLKTLRILSEQVRKLDTPNRELLALLLVRQLFSVIKGSLAIWKLEYIVRFGFAIGLRYPKLTIRTIFFVGKAIVKSRESND